MANGDPQKISVDSFATKIKEKYPEYKDVDNNELVQRIVKKYPSYEEKVDMSGLKKKPSRGGEESVSKAPSTSDEPRTLGLTTETFQVEDESADVGTAPAGVMSEEKRIEGYVENKNEEAKQNITEGIKELDELETTLFQQQREKQPQQPQQPQQEGEFQWQPTMGEGEAPVASPAGYPSLDQIEQQRKVLRQKRKGLDEDNVGVVAKSEFGGYKPMDVIGFEDRDELNEFILDNALSEQERKEAEKLWEEQQQLGQRVKEAKGTEDFERLMGEYQNLVERAKPIGEKVYNWTNENITTRENIKEGNPYLASQMGLKVDSKELEQYLEENNLEVGKPIRGTIGGFFESLGSSVGDILQGAEQIGQFTPPILLSNLMRGEGPKEAIQRVSEESAGNKIKEWSDDTFKDYPELQEKFYYKLTQGAASMIPYLATGVATGGGSLSLGVNAIIGASQNAASMYDEAYEHVYSRTGDKQKAMDVATRAFGAGLPVGLSEALPFEHLFGSLQKTVGKNTAQEIMRKSVKGMAQQGGIEGFQEMSANILNNLSAQQLYDFSRNIDEGVAESGMIGFILGGFLGGATNAANYANQNLAEKAKDNFEQLADNSKREVNWKGVEEFQDQKQGGQDAIQEQETEEVPVREETEAGEEVGEETRQQGQEVEEGQQQEEEIAPEQSEEVTEGRTEAEEGVTTGQEEKAPESVYFEEDLDGERQSYRYDPQKDTITPVSREEYQQSENQIEATRADVREKVKPKTQTDEVQQEQQEEVSEQETQAEEGQQPQAEEAVLNDQEVTDQAITDVTQTDKHGRLEEDKVRQVYENLDEEGKVNIRGIESEQDPKREQAKELEEEGYLEYETTESYMEEGKDQETDMDVYTLTDKGKELVDAVEGRRQTYIDQSTRSNLFEQQEQREEGEPTEAELLNEEVDVAVEDIQPVYTSRVKKVNRSKRYPTGEKQERITLKGEDKTRLKEAVRKTVENPTKENHNDFYEVFTDIYESPYRGSKQVKKVWDQLEQTFPELAQARKGEAQTQQEAPPAEEAAETQETQTDQVAEAKKNLQDVFSQWKDSKKSLRIADDPKQRAKEDAALMDAMVNYAKAVINKGVNNFNEFIKQLPKEVRARLTNNNLKEAWNTAKADIREQPKKGTKQQVREATGQTPNKELRELIESIKIEVKAAKEGYKQGRAEQKEFGEKIREVVKNLKTQLTPAQQRALINKATKVNTPKKLEDFVEYAERVIENSEYANTVRKADKKKRQSKRSLKRNAYGVDDGSMRNALSVDPSLLSPQEATRYWEFLQDINQKPFDRTKHEDEIQHFKDIGRQHRELMQRPIKAEESIVTQEARQEAITEFFRAKEEADQREDAEILEQHEQEYNEINGLTREDLEQLSPSQIYELIQGRDNIENGYFISPKAADALREVDANRKSESGKSVTSGRKFKALLRDFLTPYKWKAGEFIKKTKTEIIEKYIKHIPLNRLDAAMRGKVGRILEENFVQPLARGYSNMESTDRGIDKEFDKLRAKIKGNNKKQRRSMIKLQLVAIDKTYKNNPDNPELSPIQSYMEAVRDAAERNEEYSQKAVEYLEVYEEISDENGEVDYEQQEQQMTQAERDLLEYTEQVHAEHAVIVEKASIRNGENVTIHRYYTPINVMLEEWAELGEIQEQAKKYGSDINTTAQSGNLKARTKGGKPIYLEFDRNFKKAKRSLLRDYYMREEMRRVSRALNKIKASDGLTLDQRAFFQALSNTLRDISENVFVNEYYGGSRFWNLIKKRGYQMALNSVPRAGVEFASNLTHAYIYKPKETQLGFNEIVTRQLNKKDLEEFARRAGTSQFTRLFYQGYSVMMEEGAMAQRAQKKVGQIIDNINAASQTLPDQAIVRPLWLGTFLTEFKKRTGEKLDVKKFNTDQQYRQQHRESVFEASMKADANVAQSAATFNPFEGVFASQARSDDGWIEAFNKYMTRFMRSEFQSMVDGVNGLVGNNELSRAEGAALAGATLARMSLYNIILREASIAMYGMAASALGLDWPEEKEDNETVAQNVSQGVLGAALTLFVGRRLGNWARSGTMFGIEKMNLEYGEDLGLREGEYDRYKSSIVFNPVPVDYNYRDIRLGNLAPKFAGPYGEFIKASQKAASTLTKGGVPKYFTGNDEYWLEPTLKTDEAIKRNQRIFIKKALPDLLMTTIGAPFPRDISNMMSREVYQEYWGKEEKQPRDPRLDP